MHSRRVRGRTPGRRVERCSAGRGGRRGSDQIGGWAVGVGACGPGGVGGRAVRGDGDGGERLEWRGKGREGREEWGYGAGCEGCGAVV